MGEDWRRRPDPMEARRFLDHCTKYTVDYSPIALAINDAFDELIVALTREGVMMKCVAESEDVCRHLVCPRHRRRLAFCPWSANGHEAAGSPDTGEQVRGIKRATSPSPIPQPERET